MTGAFAASPEGWEVADDDVSIKFKDQGSFLIKWVLSNCYFSISTNVFPQSVLGDSTFTPIRSVV